ncbi:hypothetical protein [Pedobacter miscanthi]|jgi:hypothetical protein|uniref:hypothetical protein n=1 Tax=Pedobacter miscanthi TaxID=2259170 RepID=UPI00292DF8D5|nr:hypothetical protein [Pedobacter miscanthi]
MNTFTTTLRTSAITLIAFCIISVVAHLVFACVDYHSEKLSFLVKKASNPQIENIQDLKFESKQIGELTIKPTIMQAIILENGIYKDGGATMLFYLISCFVILNITKKKEITLESLTEKNIAKVLLTGSALFFALKFLSRILLNESVEALSIGQFKHYDNLQGFFGSSVLVLMIFNAVYSLIEYSKQLKQENDLTI